MDIKRPKRGQRQHCTRDELAHILKVTADHLRVMVEAPMAADPDEYRRLARELERMAGPKGLETAYSFESGTITYRMTKRVNHGTGG
jgi:hypothetical protein